MNKELTVEQINALNEPLPPEALKQHPTKTYLTTINPAYVIERLNSVFGVGSWYQETREVETAGKFVVVHSILHVPAYGVELQTYGGNDNTDRGDAYKGAQTDALTKAASMLGIGLHIWKNEKTPVQQPVQEKVLSPEEAGAVFTDEQTKMCQKCGTEMSYREGTGKTGKPYKAWFCESKNATHTVWINDNK